MKVYRLSKKQFARDFSGKGAEQAGGRWNSRGVAVVYTSDSRSLCVTEIAVHTPLGNVPDDYVLTTIEISDTLKIVEIPVDQLPADWNSIPHTGKTQALGDALIRENKYLVIKVPSAVVQGDFNYLINPHHPDFNKIRIVNIEKFSFDDRLFVR